MKKRKLLTLLLSLLTFVSVLLTGCGNTRVVFVGSEAKNELIRVAPNVKGKAYFWNGEDWVLSKNKITYPEGAFVGFLDGEESKEEKSPVGVRE